MEQLHDDDPRSIGPYRVIALLGSGGLGRVYLCNSPGGRRLAVKVIRPELAYDAHFRARFRREVATIQLVRSHVTAAVVDADTESPTPWLATIFLDGPTLSTVVEHFPLAEPELRRLAAALAEALQFIHRAGLVHCDLKPSNIILAPDGPRVIDFGIARAVDATTLTTTNLRVASPGYMAPEQIRSDATGPESDIFALGAVLAYAATGRSPFGSGPTDVVQYRVLYEEPDLDDVPPSLRSLVAACLAKDPGQRPTPDLILQGSTSEPATPLLTQTLSGVTAHPEAGDAPASPGGVAATSVGTQVAPSTGPLTGPRSGLQTGHGSSGRRTPGAKQPVIISTIMAAVVIVGAAVALLIGQDNKSGSTPVPFPVERLPTAAVTRSSDLNGDGFTDLVARDAAGNLWLYPGNRAGVFLATHIGNGWNTMTALVTPGDVTGDGNADILARDTAGRLWLYPGNGVGGLGTRRQIGSGWNGYTLTNAGDMNGAGRPDLLARDPAGVLWLYPLDGNAVFGTRSQIGTGWNDITILGPGDVTGDGLADILGRDAKGELLLYRGNGSGGVAAGAWVGDEWATTLVTPGNWDRAGGNDLIARDAAGDLWLYPGDNAGGFGAPRKIGYGWNVMTYIG